MVRVAAHVWGEPALVQAGAHVSGEATLVQADEHLSIGAPFHQCVWPLTSAFDELVCSRVRHLLRPLISSRRLSTGRFRTLAFPRHDRSCSTVCPSVCPPMLSMRPDGTAIASRPQNDAACGGWSAVGISSLQSATTPITPSQQLSPPPR